jgi:CheY-like chemotaxis protein
VNFVAVTGSDGEEARRRTGEAGFAEHLVKPVTLEALRKVLERL